MSKFKFSELNCHGLLINFILGIFIPARYLFSVIFSMMCKAQLCYLRYKLTYRLYSVILEYVGPFKEWKQVGSKVMEEDEITFPI